MTPRCTSAVNYTTSSCSKLVVVAVLGVLLHLCQYNVEGKGYQSGILPEEIYVRRKNNVPTPRRAQFEDVLCATIPFLCKEDEEDTEEIQCPDVLPLSNQTDAFNLEEYIAQTWFVQKQQINAFQTKDDLFCVTMTYSRRPDEKEYLDYENYGNFGSVNGPILNWNVSIDSIIDFEGSWKDWCIGQDQYGGGLLRIVPCILRPLVARVGIPHWVIAVADDYSWAIVSGGEPNIVRETNPVLCSTKINTTTLLETSGSGLWLLTRERVAEDDAIFEMEQTLLEMGVYPGDLIPVAQKGCSYEGATIKGTHTSEAFGLNTTTSLSNSTSTILNETLSGEK